SCTQQRHHGESGVIHRSAGKAGIAARGDDVDQRVREITGVVARDAEAPLRVRRDGLIEKCVSRTGVRCRVGGIQLDGRAGNGLLPAMQLSGDVEGAGSSHRIANASTAAGEKKGEQGERSSYYQSQ